MGFKKCFKNQKKAEKTMRRAKQKTNCTMADLNLTILIITSNVNGHYTSIKRQRLPDG